MRTIGLIPARQGSQRLPGKNLAILGGIPLVAIAVREALESAVFERVWCSTDDKEISRVAQEFGAEVCWRPKADATSTSPDIDWVRHLFIEKYVDYVPKDQYPDAFAILRATNPFRTADTIRRAFKQFQEITQAAQNVDSMRSMQPVSERPEKMWKKYRRGKWFIGTMTPYVQEPRRIYEQQSSTFPPLYVQNGCLEIARTRVLPESVSGTRIMPFFTEGYEGTDINMMEDLEYARWLVETGRVKI